MPTFCSYKALQGFRFWTDRLEALFVLARQPNRALTINPHLLFAVRQSSS